MNIEKVFTTLKKYNFTEYEAKVYIALLKQNPMNGNEIAIHSGVPSPKVYETLKRMTERGTVFCVSDGSTSLKKLYVPLPYDELLTAIETDFIQDNAFLGDYFEGLSKEKDVNWSELYHIDGYAASLDTLRELINESVTTIYISCWNNELDVLIGEMINAHNRGVTIISITFDKVEHNLPWQHYQHHIGDFSDRRHLGELSCVLDDRRVFILHSSKDKAHSIISSHTALTRTTVNYIRHDIYINQVVEDFHESLVQKYGPQFEKLLDRF